MKESTLERSHTTAKHVINGLPKKKLYKSMRDPTLERSHTIAKLVTSGLHKKKL